MLPKEHYNILTNKQYCVVDMPGFFDSAGPEIDAANIETLTKTVKTFSHVTIVHMIDGSHAATRCKTLKETAETFSKLINLRTLTNLNKNIYNRPQF